MEPSKQEVVFELPMTLRVHKDGNVERLVPTDFIPPSTDPTTGVSSKDIVVVPESSITARLFLPKITDPNKKLAVLVYFHGGAFVINTPFITPFHKHVTTLVSEASVVAVSVDYRKAPEHPIPAAYEDSMAALKWVASHSKGDGPEPWLNNHADFHRVFLGGDSSGANIAHNLAMAAGNPETGLDIGLLGIALVHPYFWGSVRIGSEAGYPDDKFLVNRGYVDRVWPFICPSNPDNDDPRVNPVAGGAPSLAGLGCKRVLVCVAEHDVLKDRGRLYYEALSRSGWMGVAEIFETQGEHHGFHCYYLEREKSKELTRRLAAFYKTDALRF
ncbi:CARBOXYLESTERASE 2-RELATED [Salix viminalis]|uniref:CARBOXYLESTERASE 2-RELATED n=1 Tax=Salix viminalis TaxID=40686 RepID=A0A9Q0SFS3_SALVM|nr:CARBOXYLESTERASE 2-RELATED [Salix viminalis]